MLRRLLKSWQISGDDNRDKTCPGLTKKGKTVKKITQAMIDEWEARIKDASPAPWIADIDDPGTPHENWTGKFYVGLEDDHTWCTYDFGEPEIVHVANARFIESAREALPMLIEFWKKNNMRT